MLENTKMKQAAESVPNVMKEHLQFRKHRPPVNYVHNPRTKIGLEQEHAKIVRYRLQLQEEQ